MENMATGHIKTHPIVDYSREGATIYKQGYWCFYSKNVSKGTTDQSIITTLPSECHSIYYLALATFWMNAEDAGRECAAYVTGNSVQFRTVGSPTGGGGVLVSGMWLTRSST